MSFTKCSLKRPRLSHKHHLVEILLQSIEQLADHHRTSARAVGMDDMGDA